MTEFRDALADNMYHPHGCIGDDQLRQRNADAMLAMPEMQAIRKALQTAFEYERYLTRELPESVIAWVLDEGSNP